VNTYSRLMGSFGNVSAGIVCVAMIKLVSNANRDVTVYLLFHSIFSPLSTALSFLRQYGIIVLANIASRIPEEAAISFISFISPSSRRLAFLQVFLKPLRSGLNRNILSPARNGCFLGANPPQSPPTVTLPRFLYSNKTANTPISRIHISSS